MGVDGYWAFYINRTASVDCYFKDAIKDPCRQILENDFAKVKMAHESNTRFLFAIR